MSSAGPPTPRLGSKALGTVASPLDPRSPELRPHARDALRKGSVSWLKNTEVRDLLLYSTEYGVQIAKDPPWQPAGEAGLGCSVDLLTLSCLSTLLECLGRRVALRVRQEVCSLFPKGRSQLEEEGRRQDCSRDPREAQGTSFW